VAAADVVVALAGATKTYATGTRALAPVDLAIRRGEFVTLLGPSGCGKTTLLNLIAGLVAPDGGTLARPRGGGTDAPADAATGPPLAMVFQAPTLMPWARIAANVRLPLDLAGVPRPAARQRVADALALVGLADFADHLPRELSGGMQMRASIARALVTSPDLLLMDEPFGALDEFTRQRLDGELLSLWTARGLTVVFVTHSIVEAVFLSTRVIVMASRPGRVIAEVQIDAPYPRDDVFRLSTGFAAHCQRLSALVAHAGATADAGG
jgi:NitT/TauT family transport system ATP-binding protein